MSTQHRKLEYLSSIHYERQLSIQAIFFVGCLSTLFIAVLFPAYRNIMGLSDVLPYEPLWGTLLVILGPVVLLRARVPRYALLGMVWIWWMITATLLAGPSFKDFFYDFKVIFLFSMVLVMGGVVRRRQDLVVATNFFIVTAVIAAGIAIGQQLGYVGLKIFLPVSDLIIKYYRTPSGIVWSRVAGTFDGNPNALGAFLAMSSIVSFVMSSYMRNRWYVLAFAVQIVALLLTRSNGALLALIVGFVAVLMISWQKKIWHKGIVAIILGALLIEILIAIFGVNFFSRLVFPGRGLELGSSLYTRLDTWNTVFSVYPLTAWKIWVGYGPLTSALGYAPTGEPLSMLTSFDNSYLGMFIRFGTIGVFLFLMLLGVILQHGYKAWKAKIPDISAIGLASFGAMLGLIAQAATGDFLPSASRVGLSFWFVAGLAVASYQLARHESQTGVN